MSKQHEATPGPWEIGTAKHCILGKADDCGRFTIAVMQNTHRPEQEANAQLIAKAPELREFVELIAKLKQHDENEDADNEQESATLDELIVSARKLIGRAT